MSNNAEYSFKSEKYPLLLETGYCEHFFFKFKMIKTTKQQRNVSKLCQNILYLVNCSISGWYYNS